MILEQQAVLGERQHPPIATLPATWDEADTDRIEIDEDSLEREVKKIRGAVEAMRKALGLGLIRK